MRLRSTFVALAAAAAISAPLAAHAVSYEPFTADDPAYSESNTDEPTNPAVDLVNVKATRTASTIAIATTYADFKRASYSRRAVLIGGETKGRIVEYRTAGPTSTPKVVFYKLSTNGQSAQESTCAGVKAVVNAAKDRLTFVIPTACYPDAKDDGAYLGVASFKYTPESWTPGPITNSSGQADQSDTVSGSWTWTPGSQEPMRTAPHAFFRG